MAPRGWALLRPACSHLPVLRACGKLESLLKGCLRRQSEPGSPVALHHVLTEDAVSGPGVWLWSCLDRVSGVAPARLPPAPTPAALPTSCMNQPVFQAQGFWPCRRCHQRASVGPGRVARATASREHPGGWVTHPSTRTLCGCGVRATLPYSLGVRRVPETQDSKVHLTEGSGRQAPPEDEPPEALQRERGAQGLSWPSGPRPLQGSALLPNAFVITTRPLLLLLL